MIRIIGDVNFCDGYFDSGIGTGTAIANGLDPFMRLNRQNEDYWIGNFECVCAQTQNISDPFIIVPDAIQQIKHLDLYGISNNHVMQHGLTKYLNMIKYLDACGINYAGSTTRKSTIFEHQNKKVGLLSFSLRPDNFSKDPQYWHLPELLDIENEIDKLADCDYRIAYIHWGYEFINYPNLEQKMLAHWLVDMGIDLVVGMHPHVSQGMEIYKNRHIFYSLGNAVFNMPWEPTKYGLLINVDLSHDDANITTSYLYINKNFSPAIVTNVPYKYSLPYLNTLLSINEEDEKYFARVRHCYIQYRKANRKWVIKNLINPGCTARRRIINDFIKRRILKK